MQNGDISNQALPMVLFNYSCIFDEKGIGPFKTIQLKKEIPPIFIAFLNKQDTVNTSILIPLKYLDRANKLMAHMPIREPYVYSNEAGIKTIATELYRNIAAYYDNNPVRGQLFQGRWYNC